MQIDEDPVKTDFNQDVHEIKAKILRMQKQNSMMSWKNIVNTLNATINVSKIEKALDVITRLEK